jgi:hypothetical protein
MLGGRAQGAEGEGEEGMTEITKELVSDLRKKAESANVKHPQPWRAMPDGSGAGAWIEPMGNTDYDGQIPVAVAEHAVAANPAVVLALLDALREAEQEVWRLRTTIDKDTDVIARQHEERKALESQLADMREERMELQATISDLKQEILYGP